MDPLFLGAFVAMATILVLFSGVSVALGLLIVSAGFLIVFDGMRSLELMPEILFGKLDNFALLSIPMFIIMGSSIASTRAGADLYEALERWLTRVPGGLVISNLGACALFAAMSGSSPATCAAIGKMGIPEMRKRGYPDRDLDRPPVLGRGDPWLALGGFIYGMVALFDLEVRQRRAVERPRLLLERAV